MSAWTCHLMKSSPRYENWRKILESGYCHYVDHVTKVHFLKFDLVKPISHFRASRRPKVSRCQIGGRLRRAGVKV
jgi:hypothetical protein